MTGLHGLHVLAGIAIIAVMTYWSFMKRMGKDNFIRLENTGLYWHLVDIVWIYLFPLLYLIA